MAWSISQYLKAIIQSISVVDEARLRSLFAYQITYALYIYARVHDIHDPSLSFYISLTSVHITHASSIHGRCRSSAQAVLIWMSVKNWPLWANSKPKQQLMVLCQKPIWIGKIYTWEHVQPNHKTVLHWISKRQQRHDWLANGTSTVNCGTISDNLWTDWLSNSLISVDFRQMIDANYSIGSCNAKMRIIYWEPIMLSHDWFVDFCT